MKVTKKDFDKVVKVLSKSKYPMTIMLVPKWDEIDIVIGQDAPDQIVDDIGEKLDSIGLNWGGSSGISISGASSNYDRREYSDIFRVKGGHKDYYYESTNKKELQLIQEFFSKSIYENEVDQFSAELDAFADDLAGEIKDELEDYKKDIQKSDKEINEVAGVVGIIGYILLSNTIANMLSKFAKKQFAKRDWGKGEAAAKKIYDFTHKNEEAFKAPIRRIVSLFTKDPKKIKMVSDILYAIVILLMAGQAGGEAVSYIKKAGYLKGGLYGLKAAVKGTEVSNIIKNVVQDAVA